METKKPTRLSCFILKFISKFISSNRPCEMAMNDINSISNGSILQFPTEIFHSIFDYLDCQTIIQSIALVCNQFQDNVDSYNRLKLDFSRLSECQLKSLPELIQPKNVLSISLSIGNKGEFSQVNFLFSLFKFDEFIHLKSFRLTQVEEDRFDEFFGKACPYRLKTLLISFTDQATNEIERKLNLISSMIVPYELEQINFNLLNDMFINDITSKSTESIVEHLTIYRCTNEEYHQILSSCKNLKSLTIQSFSYKNTFSSFVSSRLATLMLSADQLSMGELVQILSLTPYLHYLRINISNFQRSEIICGQSLEKFFHNHLFDLNKFQFSFTCDKHDCSLESIIESFQTPFWLNDKHWIVHCDFVFRSSETILYTPSLKINRNKNVIRWTNFFSTDDQVQLIVQDRFNCSSDKQVRRLFR